MTGLRRFLAFASLCLAGLCAAGLSPAVAPAAAVKCSDTILFDGGGYEYDFFAEQDPASPTPTVKDIYGGILDGGSHGPADTPPGPVATSDAWDAWGDVFLFLPGADLQNPTLADKYDGPADGCELSPDGRELSYGLRLLHGIGVVHTWYVDPGPLHGARILTLLVNPQMTAATVTVAQGDPSGLGGLGSDSFTGARATSDGSGVFSPNSFWGVTSDQSNPAGNETDPALAHVWDGPGGAVRASDVVLGNDTLYWDWNVTIPPGGFVTFLSYEIQAAVPGRVQAAEVAQAVEQAKARETQSPASLYRGMGPTAIASTVNWAHPKPVAKIAPVKSASPAAPVLLDASGSIGAEGLPECKLISYFWRTDDDETASGATLSHLFRPGRHEATVTEDSNCGGRESSTVRFTVPATVKLGKARVNRRAGTASFTAQVLGPGELTLSGKGLKRQVKKIARAGKVVLTVRPTGKARRSLAKTGKARVKAIVTMRLQNGSTSTVPKTLVLRRAKR